jgi:hypothetical protein
MLAALSNPVSGKRRADVVETAAEAFDRELLYLAAAFDIYGRRYLLLVDPTRDPSKFRLSLDARGYLTDHVNREYDASVLTDVARLHSYTGVCKVLRNHIHDGILPVDQHPGRSYGNSVSVALNLDAMPELAPRSQQRDGPASLRCPWSVEGRRHRGVRHPGHGRRPRDGRLYANGRRAGPG